MKDLEYLHERIPAYADYAEEDDRHLVDKQVRAYVGEALSTLRERLGTIAGGLEDRLEQVLMMCEFTNQQLMHVMDHAHFSGDEVELLHHVDHELIEIADRAAAIEHTALEDYLSQIEALFVRRAKAVFNPN
ncbi:MAG: hypothetical protein JO140_03640 [Candidatus Eremiobacteraeota bacterium]|nr:hypothetical protein [Candidatus Eremiobacteraeota bacterium]